MKTLKIETQAETVVRDLVTQLERVIRDLEAGYRQGPIDGASARAGSFTIQSGN